MCETTDLDESGGDSGYPDCCPHVVCPDEYYGDDLTGMDLGEDEEDGWGQEDEQNLVSRLS